MGHDLTVTAIPPDLLELAHAYSVATEFYDWRGRRVEVPETTVRAVLDAMDVDVSDPARALAERTDAQWLRMLPPCVVVQQGAERTFPVHVTDGDPVEVSVDLEAGGRRDHVAQVDRWVPPRRSATGRSVRRRSRCPTDLPLGYHRSGRAPATTVADAVADRDPAVARAARVGPRPPVLGARGAALQRAVAPVLGRRRPRRPDRPRRVVRPPSSARTSCWSTRCTPPSRCAPLEPSPYLPTSRRFFNPLYVRVERVVEYAELPAAARATVEALAADVHARARRRRRHRPRHRVDRQARPPCRSCTPHRAAPVATRTWRRSGAGRVTRCATSRPGA